MKWMFLIVGNIHFVFQYKFQRILSRGQFRWLHSGSPYVIMDESKREGEVLCQTNHAGLLY